MCRAGLRPRAPFARRSPRPKHVCWNSPPIKTGISQVRCGNQPSVGKHGVGACVLPSPALGPHAASLPPSYHSHPYCTASAFSPSFLSFLPSFFFFFPQLLEPACAKSISAFSPVIFTIMHSDPLHFFPPFIPFPTFSFIATTQISIAFSPNSSGLSEVHGSCVLAGSCPPPPTPPRLCSPRPSLLPLFNASVQPSHRRLVWRGAGDSCMNSLRLSGPEEEEGRRKREGGMGGGGGGRGWPRRLVGKKKTGAPEKRQLQTGSCSGGNLINKLF